MVSFSGSTEQTFSGKGDSIAMSVAKGIYTKIKVVLGSCSKEDPATYRLEEPVIVPPVVAPGELAYCQNQVVNVSDVTSRVQGEQGYALRWYSAIDGTPANEPAVNCATSGTQTIWVNQADAAGCSSDKAEVKITVNPSTSLTATRSDPSSCGATDGKLLISGLKNIQECKVEYKKEGVSQPIKSIYSDETGMLNIAALGSGTYSSITLTPTTGSLCLTKGTQEVKLFEPGAPAAPTVAGAKDYCTGEAIQPLVASGTGTSFEWFSDAALTASLGPNSSYTPTQTQGSASYYVVDRVGLCKSIAASASIKIIDPIAPKGLVGTGGPATCNGTGYDLILPTEIGVNYFIYKDEAQIGEALIGQGREQVLGTVSEEGTYKVNAEAGTCKADMQGSLVITPSKTPEAYALTGATVWEGAAATVDIKLENSETGIDSVLTGTGEALTFSREAKAASNGEYSVTAENRETGCSIEMSTKATVLVQSGVAQPTIAETGPFCNKGTTQLTATIAEGSTPQWTITPSTAGTVDDQGLITWNNAYTGNVTVNLKVSSEACTRVEKTATLATETTTLPTITAIRGDDIVSRGAVKQYQVSPVTPGMTYNWEITSNVTIQQKDDATGSATLEYNIDIPQTGIEIRVSPASAQCGTGDVVSKTVKKGEGCDLFVPNILTPRSADNSSVWSIEGIDNFPKLNIQIFNRWGGKVYCNTGMYTKPWDGTHNGQPLLLPHTTM